jgi:hypothetical protein
MAIGMERRYNLELLRDALFARCKSLWAAGLIAKLLVFALGTVVVFVPMDARIVVILGLTFAAVSEFLQWLSDRWKSTAHQLHRKLDFENSFDWKITEREERDFLARYVGDIEALSIPSPGNYFASNEKPSARRALENLRESAWWSTQLSESMGWIFVAAIVLISLGCLFLLNVSVRDVSQATSPAAPHGTNDTAISSAAVSASIVKVVTSTFLFIFSYGLFKFAAGYFSFGNKSRQIVDRAEGLLEHASTDEVQAIKLWQDYHLARDAAPLIPKWIWKLREKKLNKIWKS